MNFKRLDIKRSDFKRLDSKLRYFKCQALQSLKKFKQQVKMLNLFKIIILGYSLVAFLVS
jgi:hypothetical protein